MLHTYGNSKAEGRKLCFQKRGTAGQDYSLTHRGLLGRGSEHLWQPRLERAWSASQRPQPGPLLAVTPASANGSQRGVRQLLKVGLMWMPGGAATCMGWLLPGSDAQNRSSSSVFPLTLSLWEVSATGLAFPLGIKVSWWRVSKPCLMLVLEAPMCGPLHVGIHMDASNQAGLLSCLLAEQSCP